MHDHELEALLQQARDGAPEADLPTLDPRWDRLASGDLPVAERTALLAELSAEEDADLLVEGFTPWGNAFEEQVTQAILANQTLERQADDPAPSWFDRLIEAFSRPTVLLPMVALIAALLLVAMPQIPTPLADLPTYELVLTDGQRPLHHVEGAVDVPAGTPVHIELTPATGTDGVETVLVLVEHDGAFQRLDASAEIRQDGHVRVALEPGDLEGARRLLVLLGPDAAEPPLAQVRDEGVPGWHLEEVDLTVRAP